MLGEWSGWMGQKMEGEARSWMCVVRGRDKWRVEEVWGNRWVCGRLWLCWQTGKCRVNGWVCGKMGERLDGQADG